VDGTVTSSASSTAASPNPTATVALNLGWQLTELAVRGEPCEGRVPPDRPDLPTLSDLSRWEITKIGVATVEITINRLASTLTDAGLDPPSPQPLLDAFSGGTEDALKRASQALHYELLGLLHAVDFTLGEAYDLGRALAYTTLKPDDGPTLRVQFGFFRLQTLQGWLADLATVLPAHAARAVAVSLDLWQRVIPEPTAADRAAADQPSTPATSVSSTADSGPGISSELSQLLHRQGKLWREVLTGEKSGPDMLAASNYVDAGIELLRQTGGLIRRFFFRPAVATATFLLIAVPLGAVVLLLVYDRQAASKVTGSVLAVATALGISWSALRSTLGKALARAEQPLWQAELDTAIAEAITVLPTAHASICQLLDFARVGQVPLSKLITAAAVAAERLPRGPDSL
jgi:hypothetical protein